MFTKTIENNPATSIRFGTDGWRAVIGGDYTFHNLERVTQAYADFIKDEVAPWQMPFDEAAERLDKNPLIVVGYDRRFLSEKFAQCAAQVLAGNDFRIALFNDSVPTPLVSWAVREAQAAGGIMITASHNPPEFNGFKIKADWGGSASEKITQKVEALIDTTAPKRACVSESDCWGITARSEASYRTQIAGLIDLDRIRSSKVSVISDAMHGSGRNWVASFLENGKINVETIRDEHDAFFGGVNPEPIDSNLNALKRRVRAQRALVGLATDGDADRLGAVNEHGETMTMHAVAPLLLLHLVRERQLTGGMVTTFSQSVLMKRIAKAFNLPIYETPIGFKHIAELMLTENILLGAEESGGIGIQGHIPERDGILNNLLLLETIIAAGKTPSEIVKELHREFGEFYFDRCDVKVEVSRGQELVATLAENSPVRLAGEKVRETETLDGTKLTFDDESWLLFRQSGTEPVLRVYAEATSKAKMAKLLEAGRSLADCLI